MTIYINTIIKQEVGERMHPRGSTNSRHVKKKLDTVFIPDQAQQWRGLLALENVMLAKKAFVGYIHCRVAR